MNPRLRLLTPVLPLLRLCWLRSSKYQYLMSRDMKTQSPMLLYHHQSRKSKNQWLTSLYLVVLESMGR